MGFQFDMCRRAAKKIKARYKTFYDYGNVYETVGKWIQFCINLTNVDYSSLQSIRQAILPGQRESSAYLCNKVINKFLRQRHYSFTNVSKPHSTDENVLGGPLCESIY